jgi:TnpA family transposase
MSATVFLLSPSSRPVRKVLAVRTGPQHREHHTDGGGVSDHVFVLAYLLGFSFAPRIPNLAERRFYAFGPASNWPGLAPFIAGAIDEKLITAHWDDVLRLAASVRTGTVSASQTPKRLGAPIRVRTAWCRRCAKSAASSAPCSRSTGWKIRNCAGKQPRS